MNLKLKRGIAVLIPVMGIAAVGAVGADTTGADMTSPPADITNASPPESIVAAPEAIVVAPEPAPVVQRAPVLAERVVIELPRSVSSRSGEGSGEEIAVRTAPVDERAGMSPLYLVDQSPGL